MANTYKLIVTVELSKQDEQYHNETLGECEARLQTMSLKSIADCNMDALITQLTPVVRSMVAQSLVLEEIEQTVEEDAIEADDAA